MHLFVYTLLFTCDLTLQCINAVEFVLILNCYEFTCLLFTVLLWFFCLFDGCYCLFECWWFAAVIKRFVIVLQHCGSWIFVCDLHGCFVIMFCFDYFVVVLLYGVLVLLANGLLLDCIGWFRNAGLFWFSFVMLVWIGLQFLDMVNLCMWVVLFGF